MQGAESGLADVGPWNVTRRLADQNPSAESHIPMEMMRQGWSTSLFQAPQQRSIRFTRQVKTLVMTFVDPLRPTRKKSGQLQAFAESHAAGAFSRLNATRQSESGGSEGEVLWI